LAIPLLNKALALENSLPLVEVSRNENDAGKETTETKFEKYHLSEYAKFYKTAKEFVKAHNYLPYTHFEGSETLSSLYNLLSEIDNDYIPKLQELNLWKDGWGTATEHKTNGNVYTTEVNEFIKRSNIDKKFLQFLPKIVSGDDFKQNSSGHNVIQLQNSLLRGEQGDEAGVLLHELEHSVNSKEWVLENKSYIKKENYIAYLVTQLNALNVTLNFMNSFKDFDSLYNALPSTSYGFPAALPGNFSFNLVYPGGRDKLYKDILNDMSIRGKFISDLQQNEHSYKLENGDYDARMFLYLWWKNNNAASTENKIVKTYIDQVIVSELNHSL
jgi:hypothetical protein